MTCSDIGRSDGMRNDDDDDDDTIDMKRVEWGFGVKPLPLSIYE